MTWPNVCIILLTYERLEYAKRTLKLALDGIAYSGRLSVHIADDGSGPGYIDELVQLAGCYPHLTGISTTNAERGGYGKSYNMATMVVHHDNPVLLPLEDDWELLRPLNLDPLIETLGAGAGIGCIRLGYLGFTQDLRGRFVHAGGGTYLLLDEDSPEPHVFSGHPRLETRAWAREVGPWPEGLGAGATEFAVCHRPQARRGIAWPTDLVLTSGNLFGHFGAIQARDD